MGKKYTIELERGETAYKTVDSNGTPLIQLLAPTPYTEPEPHAEVTADAYQRGYEAGLNDAWDAARKIYSFDLEEREELFHDSERFNVGSICEAYSASEAIEKIRQYEQEQEEQIQVGDEVKCIRAGWTAIVTKIKEDGYLTLMGNDGAIANGYDEKDFIKTGRCFPEIATILEKMRGEQDG